MLERIKNLIHSPDNNDSGVRNVEKERKRRLQSYYKLCFLLSVIPVYLGYILAPIFEVGIIKILTNEADFFKLYVHFCGSTIPLVLFFLTLYALLMLTMYDKFAKSYRLGEEYGSAKFEDEEKLQKKFGCEPGELSPPKIFLQNFSMSHETYRHRLNLNTIIVGGSGAGKTRFFAKPNLLNLSHDKRLSFVVLDPKGELTAATGNLAKEEGYVVRVLDFVQMERSNGYNPFVYLQNDDDIQKLVTNLYKAVTPKTASSADPFWDNAASMLLKAIVSYIHYFAPTNEQNFNMVLELLRAGHVEEDMYGNIIPNVLDRLFEEIEQEDPQHIAVRYYKNYKQGAAKTLQSIQITLATKLEKFEIPELAKLTSYDEMELDLVGERNTIIYAIIPDNDTSYNFLISMLYTQLFQRAYYCADVIHKNDGKRLPYPIHFLMDEFANVSLPDDFQNIISTCRSRAIYCTIILQNLAQIKEKFEKSWESIVGNCDTLLYLGGNEKSTHQFISEYLGKGTIDTRTNSENRGQSGSVGVNFQSTGRELLLPDEVRMLNNDYALLFVRGHKPLLGKKYDLLKHPNVHRTSDGGMPIYEHGVSTLPLISKTTAVKNEELSYDEYITALNTEQEFEKLMKYDGFKAWFENIDSKITV